MRIPRLRTVAIIAAAGVGLGGCATYSPFGYGSGVSVSYGNAGYYDPYYGGYSGYGYSPYGYGAGYGYGTRYGYGYSPYYGWHNGFYYPGSGYYVYDRHRRPRQLTDAERRYWAERASQPNSSLTRKLIENWSGFSNGGQTATRSTQSIDGERAIRVRRSGETRAPRQLRAPRATGQSVSRERVAAQRALRSERAEARSERLSARSKRATNRNRLADEQ